MENPLVFPTKPPPVRQFNSTCGGTILLTKCPGIPDLQAWCHTLTVASRTRAVKNFYDSLKTFATNINSFVSGIGGVTPEDRQALQDKWESEMDDENEYEYPYTSDSEVDDDPFTAFLNSRAEYQGLIAMQRDKKPSTGITPRLTDVKFYSVDKITGILIFLSGVWQARPGLRRSASGTVQSMFCNVDSVGVIGLIRY